MGVIIMDYSGDPNLITWVLKSERKAKVYVGQEDVTRGELNSVFKCCYFLKKEERNHESRDLIGARNREWSLGYSQQGGRHFSPKILRNWILPITKIYKKTYRVTGNRTLWKVCQTLFNTNYNELAVLTSRRVCSQRFESIRNWSSTQVTPFILKTLE